MMRKTFLALAALGWLGVVTPLPHAAAQTATDSGDEVAKRIQRLEEQIVDLNAQLGTIESMSQGGVPSGGASLPSPGGSLGGGSDGGRLADLETQVRALSAQFGEILNRLARLEGRGGSLAPSRTPSRGSNFGSAEPDEPTEQGTGFSVGGVDAPPEPGSGGFGATVEERPAGNNGTSSGGGLSSIFGSDPAPARQAPAAPAATNSPQASGSQQVRVAANSSPHAQALYKSAYDALVQRNYRGASDSFQQFVQSFPTDPLAGSAYHWLGEAAFISGEYKLAADSFLKSSTNYPNNEKAPESLLKLGISLKRLGENQAACSSFAELGRRFPTATPILQRAEKEKSRAQC
jgi:tol-pal system protein YbgF